jgi:hypothetical protein
MNVVKFNKLRSQNNEYHCVTLEMFHYVYIYIYIYIYIYRLGNTLLVIRLPIDCLGEILLNILGCSP